MAEAEDVLVDAARHTTIFIRDLWRRYDARPSHAPLTLASLARRIDLLVTAAWGVSLSLRVALPPARPTLLHRLVHRHAYPSQRQAIPATDGAAIWLPGEVDTDDAVVAAELYRAMALQQARRALRGTAPRLLCEPDALVRDTALVLEAQAAEIETARSFPGLSGALDRLRRLALQGRPPLAALSPARRPLERLVLEILETPLSADRNALRSVEDSLTLARHMIEAWRLDEAQRRRLGPAPLFRDWWTGALRPAEGASAVIAAEPADCNSQGPVRSAHMARRPAPRDPGEDEDRPGEPGAWMIQQDTPHETAEDPFGLQRPVDRDDQTSPEEYGDMLAELSSARMVAVPTPPREVLLSDDPPASRATLAFTRREDAGARFQYPEWDWTQGAYLAHGATVRALPPVLGPQSWVDATLARHRGHLAGIRRQFEALRPERVRLRRQTDGDELDLDACVEGRIDLRAGGVLRDGWYETRRPGRRSLALSLLVDASGSTDGWIGHQRRVIDVEREALLLVSIALHGLGEPFAIMAFSGEGPHGVTVRMLKDYHEAYDNEIALRIAALEPERYTRAGAAIRHATALLMKQPAAHRLLMLLSDGKPNDADHYDGRYGVEDMRQSVTEAQLQGIFPFCLTIDRQAPGYLPQVFSASHYALLPTPEQLPRVLLDWTRRLVDR